MCETKNYHYGCWELRNVPDGFPKAMLALTRRGPFGRAVRESEGAFRFLPRVARPLHASAGLPWADCRYPVGVVSMARGAVAGFQPFGSGGGLLVESMD